MTVLDGTMSEAATVLEHRAASDPPLDTTEKGDGVKPTQQPTSSPDIIGVHSYTTKFPLLSAGELAELAESISTNGLRSPVVVTPDGLVLDGRNRLAACDLAGVKADVVVYSGTDLAEYVIDANTRRNMSIGARAMSVALVLDADGRRKDGRWKRGSVAILGTQNSDGNWRFLLSQAGVVLDFAPDLADRVRSAELTLDTAFTAAVRNRDAERDKLAAAERLAVEEAEAKVFITATDPDLAAQVGGDGPFQTYVEAQDVWARRNKEAAAAQAEATRKAQAKADAERKGRSDQYSSISRSLKTAGGYGQHQDITFLMGVYNPDELAPPQDAWTFELPNLRHAAHFIAELIKWKEAQE